VSPESFFAASSGLSESIPQWTMQLK
jgi:hypothetical protein